MKISTKKIQSHLKEGYKKAIYRGIVALCATLTVAATMCLICLTSVPVAADTSIPVSNVRFSMSPRINADRSVTFQIKAPDARIVLLRGGVGLGHGPFPMTKGDDGTWTVTLSAPVPGFHYYWFLVDGVAVNDPGSKAYFGYGRYAGGIEVP